MDTLYSNYYHDYFSVVDHFPTISPTCDDFPHEKIKIAWNIGAGAFPFSSSNFLSIYYSYIKKLSCILSMASAITIVSRILRRYYSLMICQLQKPLVISSENFTVNARFSYKAYSSTVGYQRKDFYLLFLVLPTFTPIVYLLQSIFLNLITISLFFHHLVGVKFVTAILNQFSLESSS